MGLFDMFKGKKPAPSGLGADFGKSPFNQPSALGGTPGAPGAPQKPNPITPGAYSSGAPVPPRTPGGAPSDPFSNSGPRSSEPGHMPSADPFADPFASPAPAHQDTHPNASPFPHEPAHQQGHAAPPGSMSMKNQELIISKLDAIRMAITNLDHRINQLEQKISGTSPQIEEPVPQSGVGYDTYR